MTSPTVAVGSLGGTITMTSAGTGGVVPALGADDLVAAVPQIAGLAHLTTKTLATLPGPSLGFADIIGALKWADGEVRQGAVGVVLTQGTDTLEETAYLLDLYWDRPEPLVVTGAMRSPQTPGADGPANLLAAVLAARAEASRCRGVLVVMNDEVHAAAHVSKAAAIGTDAFRSPDTGPAGHVWEGEVGYVGPARRLTPLGWPDPLRPARVALVEMCLGDDGALLQLAARGGYDGIVVSSFGAGHVPAQVVGPVSDLAARIPVVFATRTGAGTTLRHTYGFAGSEADLIARGALPAGWLRPRQARLLLWALLAQGTHPVEIAEHFAHRGSR